MVTSSLSRALVSAMALALVWLPIHDGLAHAQQQEPAAPTQSPRSGQVAPPLRQRDGFWVASVAWPTANVHAKANAGSDIRRVVQEGDLLHVAGLESGIDGDGGL
jgi:hypothetical protein